MSVLTIYNCGTGYDRNGDDIIAYLARHTVGREGRDWIINAGPGSAETAAGTPLGVGMADQATGIGMYDAAIQSLRTVVSLRPRRVNMAGWSRGSITSLMIARGLAGMPGLTCNMFLFDPVVGDPVLNSWLHGNAPIHSIGCHVNAVTVIQQMDATDFIFQAHNPFSGSANQARHSTLLQLPGSHGAAVHPTGARWNSAHRIGSLLVQEFLAGHGTPLRGSSATSTRSYLEEYSNLWLNVSANLGYTPDRSSLSNRAETTRFANQRVLRVVFNQHHIEVLNAHAPRNAMALMYAMSAERRPPRNLLQDARREFDRFPGDLPRTRDYLERARVWLGMFNP